MQIERKGIGKLLYNITIKAGLFLDKHRWLYWILAFTWGILLTLVSLIVSLVLIITFHKPKKYHGIWYFSIGKFWGGAETGIMFIRDIESDDELSMHELGHTYQNCIFGPFTLLLVTIPSIIRYWYIRLLNMDKVNYDKPWFEGSATDLGKKIIEEE